MTIEPGPTNQPIRRRLLFSVVMGLGLVAVLAVGGIGLVAASHQTVVDRTATMNGLTDARRLFVQAIWLQETAVLDYELSHGQRALGEFDAASRDAITNAARLADLARDDPRLTQVVDKVSGLVAGWQGEWAAPLMQSLRAGNAAPSTGSLAHEEGDRRFQLVEGAFAELDKAIEARRVSVAASEDADATRLVLVISAASLLFGIALLMLGIWLLRTVSAPLARLSQTAARLVLGSAVSFRAERADEIGTLATVLEQLRLDVEGRYATAVSDAERSATYNKLADLITFSATEDQLVEAAVRAIRRLTVVPNGDIELANPSQNRLVFAGSWGIRALRSVSRCRSIEWIGARASGERRPT